MVRDLLISLVPNQVSVFNFKTHPSTYHSTSGSLFWAIRSFNYGLLWYWRQSCVESIHRHSLLHDGYFCTWPSGSLIVLICQLIGWPKHEHRIASYFCSSYLPFHPNKFFEKLQGNYANIDSKNVKVAELGKF